MGPQRRDPDPHAGRGRRPKLTFAGRIDATFDDRPALILGQDSTLHIRVERMRDLFALALRTPPTRQALAALERAGADARITAGPVRVTLARRGSTVWRLLGLPIRRIRFGSGKGLHG